MKLNKISIVAFLSLLLLSCQLSSSQQIEKLDSKEFNEKITATKNAIVIDVRTPSEFESGHIENAVNIDWRSNDFETEIKKVINKEEPIFIYCRSGNRSNQAAHKMLEWGFKKIYELEGGTINWKSDSMPLKAKETETLKDGELSLSQYSSMVSSSPLVLVDFYAEWCGPCKQMEPYLKEIDRDMKDKVKLVRIDVDKNKNLAMQLGINALPVLVVYKNNKVNWSHLGYIKKEEVLKQLN